MSQSVSQSLFLLTDIPSGQFSVPQILRVHFLGDLEAVYVRKSHDCRNARFIAEDF